MLAAMMRRIEAKGQAYATLIALALVIGGALWLAGANPVGRHFAHRRGLVSRNSVTKSGLPMGRGNVDGTA